MARIVANAAASALFALALVVASGAQAAPRLPGVHQTSNYDISARRRHHARHHRGYRHRHAYRAYRLHYFHSAYYYGYYAPPPFPFFPFFSCACW